MIGKIISHYKILEKLGEGGMGEVYLAEDTKLDRKVALKFLPGEFTKDNDAKERFKREAKAAAALNHPNIITIYEIDKHEDQTYIAMEYVEGETLKDAIASAKLPLVYVIELAIQICKGLAEAHNANIIHRDIKPQNIIINNQGKIKILDFGLAKLKGLSQLTKENSTMGTIHYLSPEQALGTDIDHRTDIWSLGVILYEMLTGKLPFHGDYEQAVVYSILNETPDFITGHHPKVPPKMASIMKKVLAKKPEERYQDTFELLLDLKKVNTETKPKDIPKEKPETSIVVKPFINRSSDADQEYFSDGLTEEIITDLSHIHNLRVISSSSAMMLKNTKKDIKTIGRELDVQYVLEGSVRKAGDNLRITAQLIDANTDSNLWAEKYSGVLDDIFKIQEKVSRAIVRALKITLTAKEIKHITENPIGNVVAFECYLKARQEIFRFTEKSLERAEQLLKNGLDIVGDNPHLYAGLGYVCFQYVNVGFKHEKYITKMEEYIQRIFRLESESPQGHFLLGLMYQAFKGDQKKSLHHLKIAFNQNPNDSEVLIWLSFGYTLVGKIKAARDLAERNLRVNPLNPMSNFMVSFLYYYEGKFDSALHSVNECLQQDSENIIFLFHKALYFACNQSYDDAILVIKKMKKAAPKHIWMNFGLFLKFAIKGKGDKVLKLETQEFKKYAKRDPSFSLYLSSFYSLAGLKLKSLVWLENAVNKGLINYPFLNKYDPLMNNIRGEERFKKLMERVKKQWETFEV
jgi:non-specific serine/threonine protein kinase